MGLIIVAFIWLLLEFVFFITHRMPLSDIEIETLAYKRQRKLISKLYKFNKYSVVPNSEFKSKMNKNGELYYIDMELRYFPSYVSELLKYKKYEWIVVGIADNNTNRVKYIWINRGDDNKSVALNTSLEHITDIAKNNNCHLVLFFHNHPNSNPNKYNHLVPSKQDYISAKSFSGILNEKGIALLEYVCERGRFLEYYRSFPRQFMLKEMMTTIQKNNGRSTLKNYLLHREIGLFIGWSKRKDNAIEIEAELNDVKQATLIVDGVKVTDSKNEDIAVDNYISDLRDISVTISGSSSKNNQSAFIQNQQSGDNYNKDGIDCKLDSLSGVEFENLCISLLEKIGFNNIQQTPVTGDHGVDILAWKFNKKYAFQCKRYSGNVGNKAVQEVYTGKQLYAASGAIIITTSFFTKQAKQEAEDLGVMLWDREKLIEKLQQAQEC